MNKITQLVVFSLLITSLSYSQNTILINEYTVDVIMQDTALSINATLSIKNNKQQQSYLLFNSYISNYVLKTKALF